MTWEPRNGRSVETVLAELRAIEARAIGSASDPLISHVDHLRREHQAARRARQRELEDELLQLPEGVTTAA